MIQSIIKDVVDLRWYLPVRTPSDSATEANWNVAVEGANRELLNSTPIVFPRIAHIFRIASGDQSDPDVAPDLSFTPDGVLEAIRIGGGYTLRFDRTADELVIEHGDKRAPIWGGNQAIYPQVTVTLGNGARLRIESGPASDHANAISPNRLSIEAYGRTTILQAD